MINGIPSTHIHNTVQLPLYNVKQTITFQASNTVYSAGLKENLTVKMLDLPEHQTDECKAKDIHRHLVHVLFHYISKTGYALNGGTAAGFHIYTQLNEQPYSETLDQAINQHCQAAKSAFPLSSHYCDDIDLIIDHNNPNTEEITNFLSASLGKEFQKGYIEFTTTGAEPITGVFKIKSNSKESKLLTIAFSKSIILKYNHQKILKIDITYAPNKEIENIHSPLPYRIPTENHEVSFGTRFHIKVCIFESLFDNYIDAFLNTLSGYTTGENKYLEKLEVIENLRTTGRLTLNRPSLIRAFINRFFEHNSFSCKLNEQELIEVKQELTERDKQLAITEKERLEVQQALTERDKQLAITEKERLEAERELKLEKVKMNLRLAGKEKQLEKEKEMEKLEQAGKEKQLEMEIEKLKLAIATERLKLVEKERQLEMERLKLAEKEEQLEMERLKLTEKKEQLERISRKEKKIEISTTKEGPKLNTDKMQLPEEKVYLKKEEQKLAPYKEKNDITKTTESSDSMATINVNPTNVNPTNVNPTNVNPTNVNPSSDSLKIRAPEAVRSTYHENTPAINQNRTNKKKIVRRSSQNSKTPPLINIDHISKNISSLILNLEKQYNFRNGIEALSTYEKEVDKLINHHDNKTIKETEPAKYSELLENLIKNNDNLIEVISLSLKITPLSIHLVIILFHLSAISHRARIVYSSINKLTIKADQNIIYLNAISILINLLLSSNYTLTKQNIEKLKYTLTKAFTRIEQVFKDEFEASKQRDESTVAIKFNDHSSFSFVNWWSTLGVYRSTTNLNHKNNEHHLLLAKIIMILNKKTDTTSPEMLLTHLILCSQSNAYYKTNTSNESFIDFEKLTKSLKNLKSSPIVLSQLAKLYPWLYDIEQPILSAIVLTAYLKLIGTPDGQNHFEQELMTEFCSDPNQEMMNRLYHSLTFEAVNDSVDEKTKNVSLDYTKTQKELLKAMNKCYDFFRELKDIPLPLLEISDHGIHARLKFWKDEVEVKPQQKSSQRWCSVM